MGFILKLYALVFIVTLGNFKVTAQVKKLKNKNVVAAERLNKSKVISDTLIKYGERIHTLDTTFKFAGFKNPLKIWVYLPENYSQLSKKYPVIYLPEGAYVFNDEKVKDQWKLNIILDSLAALGKRTAIIVAVDAGIQFAGIYKSLSNVQDSFHTAGAFVNYLSDSLKPFIDKQFRTLKDADNTLIAGSALNANLSYLAFLTRNEIFGKAGLFSPSFEFAPALENLTDSLAKNVSGKLFYYYGEREDALSQERAEEIILSLGEKSRAVIYNLNDTEGWSSVAFWKKYFPAFIVWALADGNNSIINLKN